ncbi:MAG: hypothetical protein ACI9MJ_000842, partial [Alphaproteobacteria bacterium]
MPPHRQRLMVSVTGAEWGIHASFELFLAYSQGQSSRS